MTSKETGNLGEAAVCRRLLRRLYRIKARNYTVKGGEIDIIAESRRYIVFVEVKTRTESPSLGKYGRPADAVDADKKNHIIYAAKRWLGENPTAKKPRIDIAEVYLTEKNGRIKTRIEYFEGAF